MSKERDRAPLSTKIAPIATEVTALPFRLGSSESLDYEDARSSWDGSETPASDQRLAVGQRLSGRYRIERELGEGGMGVVYLATDEQVPGEIFAVKVLKQTFHPDALALLREEVHETRRLSHPNIVDVHSVNVDGTKLYVLMEYLEGKSIDALLDEEFGRGMPLSRAWPIIEDAGAALGYAHDHNVIHSDIKPANIFVTTSGRTKLLDFGIARVSRGRLLHKPLGPLALTPAYASCEMLEGRQADQRDDVYSFACVIYEMLCGKGPYGERTALEAREASAQVTPLELLSRGQNAALRRALAFGREARTASVEKLLEGLVVNQKSRTRPNAVVAGASIVVAAVALGLSYWSINKLMPARSVEVQGAAADARQGASQATTAAAAFNPPAHSIAVLPFVNISGDKEQDYFAEGLTVELLNSLSRMNELQVAARTSSFFFQGEHPDITTVAHKLNVASVLEGSVRRSGNTVRITAQLNNALTGFHLWSQNYDRDLGDVLVLQTEIADAVTSALKVTLLGDVAARIELGGTHNAAAFDSYLRGLKASTMAHNAKDSAATIAAYAEAIRLDPGYALALAARSLELTDYADNYATGSEIRASYERAQTDARLAIARAPALADGYVARANALASESLDFAQAAKEFQRAVLLSPGNAQVAFRYGQYAILMGHTDDGFAAIRRAVRLDPLNPAVHRLLSFALRVSHSYQEAIGAARAALALDADNPGVLTTAGLNYYAVGDYQAARASCERTRPLANPSETFSGIQVCLAITYEKLGRHAEAEAMLQTLQSWYGDRGAYEYAETYAQWGNQTRALEWLEKALRLHDSSLVALQADYLLDPLRDEPRFQAIHQALKFPP
jgi:TolB-like protein/Tfp pilus assembly protein PilF/predicted Ser/Thr protein kinase